MSMFLIGSHCSAVYVSFLFTIVLLLFYRNRYPRCLRHSRCSRNCRYATLPQLWFFIYYCCIFLNYNICNSAIILYICLILRFLDFNRKRYSRLFQRVSKILLYPQYRVTRVYLALALVKVFYTDS